MNKAISVSNITKSFPGVLANSDVNLEINDGAIHAIVGENGAGKSTLMKILYGMVKPDSGEISIFDNKAILNHLKMQLTLDSEWFINILCLQTI